MSNRLYIHAPNVHQGGGGELLFLVVKALQQNVNVNLCVHEQMKLPENISNMNTQRIKSKLSQRFYAEWWLMRNVNSSDMVLCFGNLPPLFKLSGHVTVYLQNRYLIDDVSLAGFKLKSRIRLVLERLWLFSRLKNVDKFIVQTYSMQKLLSKRTKAEVTVFPFINESEKYRRTISKHKDENNKLFDFIYVASGEPHKNHLNLVKAWCLLGNQGIYPSLKITINIKDFPDLCKIIDEQVKTQGVDIENLGKLKFENVMELYESAGALIYASKLESFGMPLIEARQKGIPILAAELDFVRDILDPEQTFDPNSPLSIARAVKRHLGYPEEALPLKDAKSFVKHVFERN